jgi:predicted transposase YdaD
LPSTICGKEGRKEGKKEGRKEGREGGINTGAFDMCIWPYVLHTLILVGPGF